MMIKTSIFFCKSQHRLETTATQRSARAVPITAVEAGSSSGLTGHRVSSCSRSASGRSPRSGADGGRAGSSAEGPATHRDTRRPGWRRSGTRAVASSLPPQPGPSRTSRGARHGPGHAALRSGRHCSRHCTYSPASEVTSPPWPSVTRPWLLPA